MAKRGTMYSRNLQVEKLGKINKSHRFMELEGLRGLAAVAVVLYHNLLAFYAFAFLGPDGVLSPVHNSRIEPFLHGNPLSVFLSGTFAVAIFFVLSGFVLSIGFLQTGRVDIIKKLATKRYLRLMLPALISILICAVLIKLGLSHTQEAGSITHSKWLLDQWTFEADFWQAFSSGALGIFTENRNIYNNVLWTMTTEFAGSFIVFGFLLLFGQSKYRWLMYIALGILTFNTWFLGFVIGLVLADLYSIGKIQQKVRRWYLITVLIAAGLFFGGFPFGDTKGTPYESFGIIQIPHFHYMTVSLLVGATLLVFVAIWSSQFAKLLRTKLLSQLGKYTFSLYLIHIPILYTFTSWLFIHLQHHMAYNFAALLSIAMSIPVVFMATYLFEKYVDSKSVAFSSVFADIYFGKRQLALKQRLSDIRTSIGVSVVRMRDAIRSRAGDASIDTEIE